MVKIGVCLVWLDQHSFNNQTAGGSIYSHLSYVHVHPCLARLPCLFIHFVWNFIPRKNSSTVQEKNVEVWKKQGKNWIIQSKKAEHYPENLKRKKSRLFCPCQALSFFRVFIVVGTKELKNSTFYNNSILYTISWEV